MARLTAYSNFFNNQRNFENYLGRSGGLNGKERSDQKLGTGLGFASLRKNTPRVREITHPGELYFMIARRVGQFSGTGSNTR